MVAVSTVAVASQGLLAVLSITSVQPTEIALSCPFRAGEFRAPLGIDGASVEYRARYNWLLSTVSSEVIATPGSEVNCRENGSRRVTHNQQPAGATTAGSPTILSASLWVWGAGGQVQTFSQTFETVGPRALSGVGP